MHVTIVREIILLFFDEHAVAGREEVSGEYHVSVHCCVLDDDGNLVSSKLDKAVEQFIDESHVDLLNEK